MNRFSLACFITSQITLITASTQAQQTQSPVPSPPLTARVHIESATTVTLESSDGDLGAPWTVDCSSPCDADLPLDKRYRLSGPQMRESRPFMLKGRPGQVIILHPHAASRAGFAGGIVLLSLGGLVTLVSLLAIAVADFEADPCKGIDPDPNCQNDYSRPARRPVNYASEGVGIGVGLVMVVAGIALVGANHDTKLDDADSNVRPRPVPRLPEWRNDTDPARVPRLTSFPIFRATF